MAARGAEATQGPCEHDTWAEHRAALDATLFDAAPAIELELCDGELFARPGA